MMVEWTAEDMVFRNYFSRTADLLDPLRPKSRARMRPSQLRELAELMPDISAGVSSARSRPRNLFHEAAISHEPESSTSA